MGNYRTFDIDESIVIDRKGNIKIAEDIADSLGINRHNVIQQVNKNYLHILLKLLKNMDQGFPVELLYLQTL
ncbi:MAG: hypothetical protein IIB81_02650 [Nanoarchaeota archaeon]|nr:hypothetical protein [Nanoarchaeota archaeon]